MGAFAFAEIPDADVAAAVAADQLTLIRVDDYIVDRMSVLVVALDLTRSCVPNSYGAVFRTCHHPLALTVECNTSDIVCMPFKLHNRVRVARFDVVETHHVSASCREVLLVGSDA